MEVIRWSGGGGISFFADSHEIRAFRDLNINVSTDTEDTTDSGEKLVKKKNSGGYSITLTATLSAALNVDVQETAMAMSEAARKGDTGYFYVNGAKLFPSLFMATDAKISNIAISAGKWTLCEVAWTLKQCAKVGDSSTAQQSSGGTPKKTTPSAQNQTTSKSGTKGNQLKDIMNTGKKDGSRTVESLVERAKQESERILKDAQERNKPPRGGVTGDKTITVVQFDR